MKKNIFFDTELKRLNHLRKFKILDQPSEALFDKITEQAAKTLKMPMALISIVDKDRQWFFSKIGMLEQQTARNISFCTHTIKKNKTFIISDAKKHRKFKKNPLVLQYPKVIFYAGHPLVTRCGYALGTICVIDQKPRTLNKAQKDFLKSTANIIVQLLEQRKENQKINSIHTSNSLMIEKIRSQNDYLTTLFDSMLEGVVIQDGSGKITEFNNAALDILDLTESQILGKTSYDPSWQCIQENGNPFPGDSHPSIVALKTQKLQKNIIMGVGKTSTSDPRWIKVSSVPFKHRINGGYQHHVLTYFTDITEVKCLQNALDGAHQLKNLIFKNTNYSVIATDINGIIIDYNSTSEKILEYPPQEVIGKLPLHVFHDAEEIRLRSEDLSKEFNISINPGFNTFTYKANIGLNDERRWTYISKYGKKTPVNLTVSSIQDSSNKVVGYLAIAQDISEKIKLEQQVDAQKLKLLQSSKMASLGEMAGGIAHEINNPLSVIAGKIFQLKMMAQRGPFDLQKAQEHFNMIESTAFRIAKIVKGLKHFSRDSNSDPFIATKASSLIEETISFCKERFKSKQVPLSYEMNLEIELMCRPAQISQVLLNLLSNALDAVESLQERWVKINFQIKDERIIISVIDSGQGISEKNLEKIMVPFFTTKEIGKGTGLGLSISKNIIEDHGGKLFYDSSCPNTCFIIDLPIKSSPCTSSGIPVAC